MDDTSQPSAAIVRCPRCGYDLTGATARWTDQCELEGTCPECGLEFQWGVVLVPGRSVPTWFYENLHRPLVPTFISTAWRALRPRNFWESINLAFPVSIRRLVLLIAAMLVMIHALLAIGSALWLKVTLDTVARNPGFTLGPTTGVYLRIAAWPYVQHRADYSYTINYATGPKTFNAWVIPPNTLRADLLAAILLIALMPLTYFILAQTLRRTRVRHIHLLRVAAYSLMLLGPIVVLQVLGWSEWRDVQDVLSASRSEPLVLLGELWELVPGPLTFFFIELFIVAFWWYAATRHYLRLPHAPGVVGAMVTISGLSAMLLFTLTSGWRLFFPI